MLGERRHAWTAAVALAVGALVWLRLDAGLAAPGATAARPVVSYSDAGAGIRSFVISVGGRFDGAIRRAQPTCDCLTVRGVAPDRVTGVIRCAAKPDWVSPVVLVTLGSGRTLPVAVECAD